MRKDCGKSNIERLDNARLDGTLVRIEAICRRALQKEEESQELSSFSARHCAREERRDRAHLDDGFDDDFGAREREQALVDANLGYGLRRSAGRETRDEVLH